MYQPDGLRRSASVVVLLGCASFFTSTWFGEGIILFPPGSAAKTRGENCSRRWCRSDADAPDTAVSAIHLPKPNKRQLLRMVALTGCCVSWRAVVELPMVEGVQFEEGCYGMAAVSSLGGGASRARGEMIGGGRWVAWAVGAR